MWDGWNYSWNKGKWDCLEDGEDRELIRSAFEHCTQLSVKTSQIDVRDYCLFAATWNFVIKH